MTIHGMSSQTEISSSSMEKVFPVIAAAGSLCLAMDEIIQAYQEQGEIAFAAKYSPSGKLRQEIETGAKVDVFASASTEHTEALAKQNLLGPSEVFAHNDLCVIAIPELNLIADNMLEVLSSPSVRVATSTPVSDPMGDYTWQFFRNADKKHAGFYHLLDTKARKLSGARVPAAGEKLPYITAFEEDKTDAYIMYSTIAVIIKRALPYLNVVHIPDDLNVRSDYSIAADLHSTAGKDFVRFVMQEPAQNILKKHGFD